MAIFHRHVNTVPNVSEIIKQRSCLCSSADYRWLILHAILAYLADTTFNLIAEMAQEKWVECSVLIGPLCSLHWYPCSTSVRQRSCSDGRPANNQLWRRLQYRLSYTDSLHTTPLVYGSLSVCVPGSITLFCLCFSCPVLTSWIFVKERFVWTALFMHHLTCGISSLLHSVNLILFTLLLVHLILDAHITSSQSPPSLSPSVTPSAFYSRYATHLFHICFLGFFIV